MFITSAAFGQHLYIQPRGGSTYTFSVFECVHVFSFCTTPRLFLVFAFVHILACIHLLTALTEVSQWL